MATQTQTTPYEIIYTDGTRTAHTSRADVDDHLAAYRADLDAASVFPSRVVEAVGHGTMGLAHAPDPRSQCRFWTVTPPRG